MHLPPTFLIFSLAASLVTTSTIPDLLTIANLSPASPPHFPTALPLHPPSPHDTTDLTTTNPALTFLQTVTATILSTTASYPAAIFRLVSLTSPSGPTSTPAHLTAIRIIFSLDDDPRFNSVHVDMSGIWGVWYRPVFSTEKVADYMGNMRLDVRMELSEAWQLVKEKGVVSPGFLFDGVALYWPTGLLARGEQRQPFYRFEGPFGYVYVGTWTNWVTNFLSGENVAGRAS